MNIHEKSISDLEGYLLVKNVLTREEIAVLNEVAALKFKTYP